MPQSASFLGTAITRLAVAGSSFGFSIALAKLLAPDDLGAVFFAVSVLIGASTVARFGNDVNLIWNTSRLKQAGEWGKANSLLALSLAVAAFFCALIVPLPWLWQRFVATHYDAIGSESCIALALLALPAMVSASLFSACLKAIGHLNRATLLEQGGIYVLALPLLFFMVALGIPVTTMSTLVILVSCSYFLALAGGSWWFCGDRLRRDFSPLSHQESSIFLKSSSNMAINAMATYCVYWGNIILVGLIASAHDTGIFAVTDRIAITQAFVLSIVHVVFSHRLADAYYTKKTCAFVTLARRSAFIATAGSLPICLIIVFFPDQLLSILGKGYEDGVLTLRLLGLAYLFPALSGAAGYVLLLTGHDQVLRNVSLYVALAQLILVSLMTWRFGAAGAAGAVLVAYIIKYVIMQILTKKLLGFYIIPVFSTSLANREP